MAGVDPQSPHYLDWLQGHRDVTAHFPELHPLAYQHGDEEIANALTKAAEAMKKKNLLGTITVGESPAQVRFGFADEVALHLLPDIVENPDEVKKLSGARIALGEFICAAVAAYMKSLDAGVVQIDS